MNECFLMMDVDVDCGGVEEKCDQAIESLTKVMESLMEVKNDGNNSSQRVVMKDVGTQTDRELACLAQLHWNSPYEKKVERQEFEQMIEQRIISSENKSEQLAHQLNELNSQLQKLEDKNQLQKHHSEMLETCKRRISELEKRCEQQHESMQSLLVELAETQMLHNDLSLRHGLLESELNQAKNEKDLAMHELSQAVQRCKTLTERMAEGEETVHKKDVTISSMEALAKRNLTEKEHIAFEAQKLRDQLNEAQSEVQKYSQHLKELTEHFTNHPVVHSEEIGMGLKSLEDEGNK